MMNNPLFNQYYQQLICKIFILGHPSQGESIVFLLYGDNRIIYSCVVDSFVQNDRVVPKDLLFSLGIDKITDVFWTHPHDDHSNGLVELIETFTPQRIYIPVELQRLPNNNRSVSASVLTSIRDMTIDVNISHGYKVWQQIRAYIMNSCMWDSTLFHSGFLQQHPVVEKLGKMLLMEITQH